LAGSGKVTDQLQLWDFRTKAVVHTFYWDENPKVLSDEFSSKIQV
jgi:hypothetical protein